MLHLFRSLGSSYALGVPSEQTEGGVRPNAVPSTSVANRVRQLRTERGWTVQDLADACAAAGMPSLTRGTLAKIESRKAIRKSVTVAEIAALARAFGVQPTDLVETDARTGSPTAPAPARVGEDQEEAFEPGADQRITATDRIGRPGLFFISYSPADESWATWIAAELEQAGHRTMLAAWDFVPGASIVDFTDQALNRATAVVAVLSPDYLRSRQGRQEWQAALLTGPTGAANRLVTVRVAECHPDGLLGSIPYVDLVGATEDQARHPLLNRARQA